MPFPKIQTLYSPERGAVLPPVDGHDRPEQLVLVMGQVGRQLLPVLLGPLDEPALGQARVAAVIVSQKGAPHQLHVVVLELALRAGEPLEPFRHHLEAAAEAPFPVLTALGPAVIAHVPDLAVGQRDRG